MFTDFEYADKRLSDFGWVVGHIGDNSGVSEVDIGCDITFNTVKNNHSSIHYVSSTSYENVYTSQPFDIFKNPCGKNQEDMYVTNDEVSSLTKWLNRHGYRKFKPVYDSDDSDIHYYGSFNVKKKTINDRVVGLVLTFNSNAPYGFSEQNVNEHDWNYTYIETSGSTIVTTDSANVPPLSLTTFGKSSQKTYEGNQLFDVNSYVQQYNCYLDGEYIVFDVDNSEGTSTLYGMFRTEFSDLLTPSTNYLLIAEVIECSIGENSKFWLTGSAGDLIPQIHYGKETTSVGTHVINVTTNDDFSICTEMIRSAISVSAGDTLKVKFRLSIIADTTVTADTFVYEPFVGGEASPNLKYPQEVTPIGEGGSVNEWLYGKNLYVGRYYFSQYSNGKPVIMNFNEVVLPYKSNNSESMGIAKIVPCVKGETYAIKAHKLNEYGLVSLTEYENIESANTTKNALNSEIYNSYKTNTIIYTAQTNGILLIQLASLWTNGTTNIHTCTEDEEIQVEIGTVATEYEAPKDEQSLTFQTPNGLHGIPLGQTIPDVIANSPIHMSGVYHDGEQYWIGDTKNEDGKDVQRIKAYTVDDFKDVIVSVDSKWYDSDLSYSYEIKNTRNNIPKAIDNCANSSLCTHFVGYSFNNFYNKGVENGFLNAQSYIVVNISKSFGICTTVDEFIQYCIDNDVKFYKVLADPIITDTSEEELTQFNALVMNKGYNTLINDAGAYTELEYIQDYGDSNTFVLNGDGDELTNIYPNVTITCHESGDLVIKNLITGTVLEILNCSKNETIYINGEQKFIDSDNKNHKSTTLFNDFNYSFLEINVTDDDFNENIYETSIPCKIVIDYSPIRKVGI